MSSQACEGDQLSSFADEEIKRSHFCLDVEDKLKVIRPFFTVTVQNPPPGTSLLYSPGKPLSLLPAAEKQTLTREGLVQL